MQRNGSQDRIVLLGAHLALPEDVKKDIPVVDFPLPTAAELMEQVDAFIAALPDKYRQRVNLSEAQRATLVAAMRGLTKSEADACLAQAAIRNGGLDDQAVGEVTRIKSQIFKSSGALEYQEAKIEYDKIGGLDLLKQWAREEAAARSPEAADFGLTPTKGCLVVGVPGCGKSLTARAIAGDLPLIRLDIGALFGGLVGESESRTRTALKTISAAGRCVVWIDEIEKGLGGDSTGDSGVALRVLAAILTWMQEQADALIFATANDVSGLRPELLRRFAARFFVDLPKESERQEIMEIHLRRRRRDPLAFNLTAIVAATEGFTGAEIEETVNAALRAAFIEKRDICTSDLVAAASAVVPLSVTAAEQIKGMREWARRARPASSIQTSGQQPQSRAARLQ
jgi:SpoVK/Ycf46/Vps4 family AAA+-type ATPase